MEFRRALENIPASAITSLTAFEEFCRVWNKYGLRKYFLKTIDVKFISMSAEILYWTYFENPINKFFIKKTIIKIENNKNNIFVVSFLSMSNKAKKFTKCSFENSFSLFVSAIKKGTNIEKLNNSKIKTAIFSKPNKEIFL